MTAALSLAVFTVIVGVGQMFVITLGPGNVDLSLPANIGLASAVAMKTMGGDDSWVAVGLAAALACGLAVGARQLSPDPGAAHPADHRDAVGELHHPVDRHQLWARLADQAAARLRRLHQYSVSLGVPLLAILTRRCSRSARASRSIGRSGGARFSRSARTFARRGWRASRSSRIRFATYALCGALGGSRRRAARRLFPRRQCRHRQ